MKYFNFVREFWMIGLAVASLTGCYLGKKPAPTVTAFDLTLIKEDDFIQNVVPIAIIGSGPAGLAAGVYGARLGPKTVVFAGPEPGGQLTKTSEVENWPGVVPDNGAQIMELAQVQARDSGAIIVQSTVESVNFDEWPYILELDDGTMIHALSVIICTGAQPRLLGIPGEEEFWGVGVSGCAICDAPFFKDKRVVVVGGGDSAAEQAMQLAVYAKWVTVFVRKPAMRASAAMQKRLQDYENISVVYNTVIEEIVGDEGLVSKVSILSDGKRSEFETDGVFIAIGHEPNSVIFKDQVACDELGYIITAFQSQETDVKGVYAAGDIDDDHYRQAGTAAGEGIKAGIDAYSFLVSLGYNPRYEKQIQDKLFDPIDLERQALEQVRSVTDLETLLDEEPLVVLDFYTQGCISCKQLEPILEILAAEYADTVSFVKLDAAQYPEIAKKYGITTVPSLAIIKQGELQKLVQPEEPVKKSELQEVLDPFL